MEIIPKDLLLLLSEAVSEEMGLNFSENRFPDLEKAVASCKENSEFSSNKDFVKWLLENKKNIETLTPYLTVGETYFFREKNSFEILENHVLPEIFRKKEKITIWSSGCSTGEEPYSIAILINKIAPDKKVRIIATDINPDALKKADQGMYRDWSFRDTLPWVKKYFTEKEHFYAIKPEIKKMVEFSRLNLVKDTYPSPVDIIFCRNVLMYFSHKMGSNIVSRFYNSLVSGGWLLINPAECMFINGSSFSTVNFPGAIFYRKEEISSKPFIFSSEIKSSHKTHEFLIKKPFTFSREKNCEPSGISIKRYVKKEKTENDRDTRVLYSDEEEKSISSLLEKAKELSKRKQFKEGEEICRDIINRDKINYKAHYLLATILQEENKIEEAIISLKKVIYLEENFVSPYFLLGNIYLQQGNKKESNKNFKNAMEILNTMNENTVLEDADGITAGKFKEIISTFLNR